MSDAQADYKELMSKALVALKKTQEKLASLERAAGEPIAIISMACRFPGGVNDPDALWQLLVEGRDAIGEIPRTRWDVERFYDSDPDAPGKMSTSRGGFIDHVDGFDPLFFGMSPKEAVFVDPQHRLMLEVAWEAMENAHLTAADLNGSRSGVLVGISTMDYCNLISELLPKEDISRHIGTGTAFSPAAGRIAYLLGLNGPAMAVDTACSSSLVATHLAVESLRRKETDLMLVGGVGLILSPMNSITFSRARMLAADGRCKPFSAAADGYGRGEGVAMVMLKRLSDAERDGDTIHALIRGSAVNQDGASGGLTIPNGPAQQAVVRQALANGRVEAADISYVETHGTGTSLGDPIEIGALGAVFKTTHDQQQPLLVGAVKSNIGHTEAAAGLAGLIKLVLQLQYQHIPAMLHFATPSPHIDWTALPLRVADKAHPWPARNGKWLAGVSSFGFSGTNAHVVLERAPQKTAAAPMPTAGGKCMLPLSAQKPEALQQLAARYAASLRKLPQPPLEDLCRSALLGRTILDERIALVAGSVDELLPLLDAVAAGQVPASTYRGSGRSGRSQITGFFFGAAPAELDDPQLQRHAIYRDALEQCQTGSTRWQLQLFAHQYAQARLWQSWGVQPQRVEAEGLGFYALACIAGVLSVQQALQLLQMHVQVTDTLEDSANYARLLSSLPRLTSVLPGAEKLAHDDFWLQLLQPDLAPVAAVQMQQQGVWLDLGRSLAEVMACQFAAGAALDWSAICTGWSGTAVKLPNYPFQRQRCWPRLK